MYLQTFKNFVKKNLFLLLIFSYIYLYYPFSQIRKINGDKLSIVVIMKNLTEQKHNFFYKLMKALFSSRNFYFIKTIGKELNPNYHNLVKNSSVKIVLSNFPDSIFLPLVLSLFGNNIPELIFLIEEDDLINCSVKKFQKWFNFAYKKILNNGYDYIFGNSQIINRKKIGCTIL